MNCPRCKQNMTKGTFSSVQVHRCDTCEGIALKQTVLLSVLENLSMAVYGDINVNVTPPAVQGTSAPLTCPDCRSTMERHGYMGRATKPL